MINFTPLKQCNQKFIHSQTSKTKTTLLKNFADFKTVMARYYEAKSVI